MRSNKLFDNSILNLVTGVLFILSMIQMMEWGVELKVYYDSVQRNSFVLIGICFIVTGIILDKLFRFPGERSIALVLTVVTLVFLFAAAVVLMLRLNYSRTAFGSAYLLSIAWYLVGRVATEGAGKVKLALVPFGRVSEVGKISGVRADYLSEPTQVPLGCQAVVADFQAVDLSQPWVKFLSKCALKQIPVYHYKQVVESLSGRVKIEELSENMLGSLLPSPLYNLLKRIIDIVIVVITLPFVGLIVVVASFAIKWSDGSPTFFKQERVGRGGKPFTMYKLRTMGIDAESGGAALTSKNDNRISRLGQFLRKYRIDELPQMINVLRGEMSLVGPRPEQKSFAKKFENEIPFYEYRHVIKPGITGWAQVNHGYADDAEETRKKIEYDFYYIKHFSFSLDLMIIFRTLRVLFRAEGAR